MQTIVRYGNEIDIFWDLAREYNFAIDDIRWIDIEEPDVHIRSGIRYNPKENMYYS